MGESPRFGTDLVVAIVGAATVIVSAYLVVDRDPKPSTPAGPTGTVNDSVVLRYTAEAPAGVEPTLTTEESFSVAKAAKVLAPSPAEALALTRVRPRPVRPGGTWRRLDGCRLIADAPKAAVSYQDGGLVRRVYWDCENGTPQSWVGILRLTRQCGNPPSEIEITYSDGRVEPMAVPTVPCGGY